MKKRAPQSPELDRLTDALTQAYRCFNASSDPVVTDACIFEINALRARRNSLLRELRQEQGGYSQSS
ncbi:MAG: hypothetical protein DBX49_07870 [Clostridia bacterium]|nr:hypothetical protein [Oscillospiraceae bacterium]MBS5433844.1 hypothetical protein [Bacillota bacterium]PWM14017.1 MAG: hypothetical protein DBX49_07870 [Clostridia bacterium]